MEKAKKRNVTTFHCCFSFQKCNKSINLNISVKSRLHRCSCTARSFYALFSPKIKDIGGEPLGLANKIFRYRV